MFLYWHGSTFFKKIKRKVLDKRKKKKKTVHHFRNVQSGKKNRFPDCRNMYYAIKPRRHGNQVIREVKFYYFNVDMR